MIYWIIILVYVSFVIDFLIWPIPSEASTRRLLSNRQVTFLRKFSFVGIFFLNLVFYLTPLGLSFYCLTKDPSHPLSIPPVAGIGVSVAGRLISLAGAKKIVRNDTDKLITGSIFRWSRNPIVLGLHLTILGLLMVFPYLPLWIAFGVYLWNIHSKIKIEELHLKKKYGSAYVKYKSSTPRYLWL